MVVCPQWTKCWNAYCPKQSSKWREDQHPSRKTASVHQLIVDQIGFSLRSKCGEMHVSAFLKPGRGVGEEGSLTACLKMPVYKFAHWLSLTLWDFNLSMRSKMLAKVCALVFIIQKQKQKMASNEGVVQLLLSTF